MTGFPLSGARRLRANKIDQKNTGKDGKEYISQGQQSESGQ